MARKARRVGGIEADFRLALAGLRQDVQEAGNILNRGFKNISNTLKLPQLAAGLQLVQAGFRGLGATIQTVGDAIERGQKFHELTTAFKNLYGASNALGDEALPRLRTALRGTVDDLSLLQTANSAALEGLSPEQFLRVAEAAEALGDAAGKTAKEALEELSRGLALGQERLLKQYIGLVDNKKAEEDYARSLGVTADQLTELGKLEAYRIAALDKIEERAKVSATTTRTAGDAYEQLGAALNNAATAMSNAANSSIVLEKSLTGSIGLVDRFSDGLSKLIRNLDLTIDRMFNLSNVAQIEEVLEDIAEVEAALAHVNKTLTSTPTLGKFLAGGGETKWAAERKPQLEAELAALKEKQKALTEIYKVEHAPPPAAPPVVTAPERKQLVNTLKAEKEAAKDAADALDDYNDKLREFTLSGVEDALSGAIERGDIENFQSFFLAWKGEFSKATEEALAESIGPEKAKELSEMIVGRESAKKIEEFARTLEEKQKEAYQNSIEFWRNTFENAITGVSFSLEDALKQIAVGFAAELASAMLSGISAIFSGIKSPQDLGGALGQIVLGELGIGTPGAASPFGGAAQGALSALGLGSLFEGGAAASTAGVILDTGAIVAADAIPAGATAIGSAAVPASGGILGGAGAAISAAAPYLAVAAIAATVGPTIYDAITDAFESPNPERTSREEGIGALEEIIKQRAGGSITLQGPQGPFELSNIVAGDSNRFRDTDWVAEMADWGEQASGTFVALGEALEEVLGISEDVGGQIGFILGENLLGNIDNARLAVAQLGFSFEQLKEGLLNAAIQGEMRWEEFNVNLRNLSEAFEPGLEAVGDFEAAFNQLVDSGGRGMIAVRAFQNIAIEAAEAGITTLDELKQRLIAQGADPEQVEAVIQAAVNRGITDLQQWANTSTEAAGSIVGDMEAISGSLHELWSSVTEDVNALNQALAEIPREVTTNIRVNIDDSALDELNSLNGGSTAPATEEPFSEFSAAGRIISSPTPYATSKGIGLMGEAGPEAILPLRRIGGKLGILAQIPSSRMGSAIINIDARGAERGVEQDILEALSLAEPRIVDAAVSAFVDRANRGFFGGRF